MARPVSIAPVNFSLIRYVVKARGLTLTEVAEHLDVSIQYFSGMLSGYEKINDERLIAISQLLEVSPDYFRTPTGRLAIQKVDADLIDWALTESRGDVKELQDYLAVSERMGYIDFTPELPDAETVQDWAFWKKETIVPFRSDKCIAFWEFDGDEIIIRGPARCGKSTLILEWLITTMFQNAGLQVIITRAFSVDLDAVRQNLLDLVKYRFSDPLSAIRVIGGTKFHTVQINGGQIDLRGIDRPGGQMGAGYDIAIHSQAEQIKKDKIDQINSRVTAASQRWQVDGVPMSRVIYDVNPNRLDHYLEGLIKDGVPCIQFDFVDHPAYFTESGEETELYQQVQSRLSRLEGVWRQRLLEGKAANPEGTIFMLEPCHLLDKLPSGFFQENLFYRGLDFGMKDPNVCLWFGLHRATGDLTVFREWRRVGVDTIEFGDAVNQFSKERVLATVQDDDENLQSILRRDCGIVTELARKGPNSIASGITLVQHRLRLARDGEAGGLYFYNDPVVRDPVLIRENEPLTVIDEADLYAWSDTKDMPLDKHNHGWDIIRYMCDYLETSRAAVGFGSSGARRQKRQ